MLRDQRSNTNTGNGVGHYDNNTYADHDGNVYKYNPSSGVAAAHQQWLINALLQLQSLRR
ncbi:MAG TPA: hypothetical protein VKG65_11625 [Terriglobales bacterium]|nr:hypothetical protein [Terriglobales bacterium]